ncbi:MAG TPA: tetratricopeptide repeat protein [Candidatus Binataceae bacterium]|nr:tetratricopeptide repeat protein [Candidatus Binataceae bacterium]
MIGASTIRGLVLLVAAIILTAVVRPLNVAAAGNPVPEQICNTAADYALGAEDYQQAIRLHRQVLEAEPANALAHYHLGFAYRMAGHSSEELHEYLEAARLGLKQWDLFLNLGLAYLEQGDIARSIDSLKEAAMLGPGHNEAHFNLGLAYERAGRLTDALHEMSRSIELAPRDPDGRNMRAMILAELGDYAQARKEWAQLEQDMPNYAPAHVNLALLDKSYCAQGLFSQASK